MKKIFIVILTIFPLLTYGQANKIYRKALKTADLKQCINLFSEVIKLEPKNFDAYFYRGIAKNDLGDYNGAIVDYSKIIVFEPDADTYYNRGNSKYSLQDFKGAKADYDKAIKLAPNFTDALYSLGCVKYDLGEYKKAISDFTKVINNATQSRAFILDASSYRLIKDYKKDLYHYANVVLKTYTLRALSFKVLKSYKKALEDYTYVVLVARSSDAYYNRGEFYLGVNYYQKASNDFSMSIKKNENNSFAYFYRGITYFLLGKYNDAIIDFSKALEFDSTDFDAILGLALCYETIARNHLIHKKIVSLYTSNY